MRHCEVCPAAIREHGSHEQEKASRSATHHHGGVASDLPRVCLEGRRPRRHLRRLDAAVSGVRLDREVSDQERGDALKELVAHLSHQRDWSTRTFGPGPRTLGILDHIRKELHEIESDPHDLGEWIDVVILALDGAWRAGHSPEDIVEALMTKQAKNERRQWPDWRGLSQNVAIEHVR